MPKKKKPDEEPKEQFKRFTEAARQHGLDDNGAAAAERSFKSLTRKKGHSKGEPERR